jgi:hypothetical protein
VEVVWLEVGVVYAVYKLCNSAFIGRWCENLLGYSSIITVSGVAFVVHIDAVGGDHENWGWRFVGCIGLMTFFLRHEVVSIFEDAFEEL